MEVFEMPCRENADDMLVINGGTRYIGINVLENDKINNVVLTHKDAEKLGIWLLEQTTLKG